MKLFTSVALCALLASSAAKATTYTLSNGNFNSQTSSITFNNGDTIKIPSTAAVNFKAAQTISANIVLNIYGTLAISQSGSVLTLGNNSKVNLFPTGGTLSCAGNDQALIIGSTTKFTGNQSVTASSSVITYSNGSQGFGGGNALPLKFVSFDAVVKNNTVNLSWTATNDGPATVFAIQQSIDGKSWSDIATVKATGDDHQTVSYSYETPAPKAATAIYRIRYAGTTASEVVYSAARLVNLGTATNTTAVIGAAAGKVQIALSGLAAGTTTSVMITTMEGKLVYSGSNNADNSNITIPVAATGVLVVTVTDNHSFRTAQKIAIQ